MKQKTIEICKENKRRVSTSHYARSGELLCKIVYDESKTPSFEKHYGRKYLNTSTNKVLGRNNFSKDIKGVVIKRIDYDNNIHFSHDIKIIRRKNDVIDIIRNSLRKFDISIKDSPSYKNSSFSCVAFTKVLFNKNSQEYIFNFEYSVKCSIDGVRLVIRFYNIQQANQRDDTVSINFDVKEILLGQTTTLNFDENEEISFNDQYEIIHTLEKQIQMSFLDLTEEIFMQDLLMN